MRSNGIRKCSSATSACQAPTGTPCCGRSGATLGTESPHITIALTAYAGEKGPRRSAAAGFHRHLAKPLDPIALVEIVAEMLAAQPFESRPGH